MSLFLLAQLFMLMYAVAAAKKDAALTLPWRYGAIFPDKERLSRQAHAWGARMTLCVALGFAYMPGELWTAIGLFMLNLLVYWVVFDICYALLIQQKWDYIGDTAELDSYLRDTLGENAGRKKALIGGGIVVAVNTLVAFL